MLLLPLLLACSGCNEPTPDEPHPAAPVEIDHPDIVVVVVDALRPDHMGLYGYERDTTPNLDAWAEQAVVFEDAMAHGTWTRPALASLLTGVPAHAHGMLTPTSPPSRPRPAVHQVLHQREGYTTAAVLSSTLATPKQNPFLRGYQRYEADVALAGKPFERATSGDAIERATTVWTEHHQTHPDEPLFLLVHLVDPHRPYIAHPEHPFGDSEVDRYDSEIAAVDAALGPFLERVGDEAVVLVTADHGELLGEHGDRFGHNGPPFQELIHVPMLLKGPGVRAERISKLIRHGDVPTGLLETARLDREPRKGPGGWRIGPFGDVVYGRRTARAIGGGIHAVRDRRWVLFRDPESGRESLYDLEADPQQQVDLAEDPEHARTVEQLRALLDAPGEPREEGAEP